MKPPDQLFATRAAVEAEMSASYFNPGDALVATDERAVQAIADWYDRTSDGCFDSYLHPDDVEFSFQRRLDAISQGQDPQELAGPGLAALTDLQDEEGAVPAVFTNCEVSVLDPIMDQVESDYHGR